MPVSVQQHSANMSGLQPYRNKNSSVQQYGGNRDRWERRNVDEFKMDMGNGVKYSGKTIVDETRRGNVRVQRVEQVNVNMSNGQKLAMKHTFAERY